MKAKIPSYNTQHEKREFFSLEIIDTIDQLNEFMCTSFLNHHNEEGIWRGLPESRFKLYNSLQRKNVLSRKLKSVDGVLNYIENSSNKLAQWNKSLILKYLNKNHNVDNLPCYAALSILQHHGCETPLLDWTRNPNVALYFATNNDVVHKKRISNSLSSLLRILINSHKFEDIDNYFSIYFLKKEHPYYKLNSRTGYNEIYGSEKEIVYVQNAVNFVIEHGGDEILQQEAEKRAKREYLQNAINNTKLLLGNIEDTPIQLIEDCLDDNESQLLNINYNINAQNGLFVINADPFKPLEEAIFERIDFLAKNGDLSVDEAKSIQKENFICYDIHKKFISKIINDLKSKNVNVTKDTMFPSFNKLKDEVNFDIITENIS